MAVVVAVAVAAAVALALALAVTVTACGWARPGAVSWAAGGCDLTNVGSMDFLHKSCNKNQKSHKLYEYH